MERRKLCLSLEELHEGIGPNLEVLAGGPCGGGGPCDASSDVQGVQIDLGLAMLETGDFCPDAFQVCIEVADGVHIGGSKTGGTEPNEPTVIKGGVNWGW